MTVILVIAFLSVFIGCSALINLCITGSEGAFFILMMSIICSIFFFSVYKYADHKDLGKNEIQIAQVNRSVPDKLIIHYRENKYIDVYDKKVMIMTDEQITNNFVVLETILGDNSGGSSTNYTLKQL